MPRGVYPRTEKHRQAYSEARKGTVSPLKGVPRSQEDKDKISAGRRGIPVTAETREKISNTLKAKGLGEGFYIDGGYRVLTKEYNHPLATQGQVKEHRKVLYDSIGEGPHRCHWEQFSGCGQDQLQWHGDLCTDHVNRDTLDNRSENLVPSCRACNSARKGKNESWGM